MKLAASNISVMFNDKKVSVCVYTSGREGALSPTSYCYKYKGRFISAYEMKKRGWADLSLNQWFKIIYNDKIENLTYNNNPFMSLISKNLEEFNNHVFYIPQTLGE